LFPGHNPEDAARALVKALSMARGVLSALAGPAAGLLQSDRANIWVAPEVPLEIDAESHEQALRAALAMSPGRGRDDGLVAALAEEGALLADEPYADWALRPREQLDGLRQRARLELARDRARGAGRTSPDAVTEAWESCLGHDTACEEAAAALMRAYSAQGLRHLVVRTYERCRAALEELGLCTTPALDEVWAAAALEPAHGRSTGVASAAIGQPRSVAPSRQERRAVTVLFADVAAWPGATRADPEDVREIISDALARVITEVEGLGGMVTSVSGCGLQALFGAPESHEDDPERATRAAFRALLRRPPEAPVGAPVLRFGVETGPAVVGPIGAGGRAGYGAIGAVVGTAAALQAMARPGSALVGSETRAATEGIFEWGATEELVLTMDTEPVVASYLERPRARAPARQSRLGSPGPLVGRQAELSVLGSALRGTEEGTGSVVVLVGEPGLGKTRLVQECRSRFMAWVGARSGRLPLWLEGRCASYASTTPYGLYQHLLAAWTGVDPDQGEEVVAPALEKALRAVMGNQELFPVLARMMGLAGGASLTRMSPPELQRATFAAMRSVVSRLVGVGPTVLVLEDLHWADAISLRLTEELSSLVATGPLLLVITRRPEPDVGVSASELALAGSLGPKLAKVELAPLARDAERELARSLVGEGASQEVLDAVLSGVEGNPLFLEERLVSMIDTGALVRDERGWHLEGAAAPEVPQVLEQIVRSRVDRLGAAGQDVVRAASVLGQEFGLPLLSAVCGADEALRTVLADMCGKGLMQEVPQAPEPTYRFRHALIREATYRGLLRAERRRLHGRTAWALEAMMEGRLEEVAAVLGAHFAAAGEAERAVHYFELAGDHAMALYANEEAGSLYRSALAVVGEGRSDPVAKGRLGTFRESTDVIVALAGTNASPQVPQTLEGDPRLSSATANPEIAGDHATAAFSNDAAVSALRSALAIAEVGPPGNSALIGAASGLWAKLAELYWRTGRRGEARQAYQQAIRLASPGDAFRTAYLQIRLGRLESADHCYDAAMAAFDTAEELLEAVGHSDEATAEVWLELMMDGRGEVYRNRKQPELLLEALEAARPVVEAWGKGSTKCTFYRMLAQQRASQDGYRVSEEDIANLRRALAAATESGEEIDIGWSAMLLGYFSFLRGDLEVAQEQLESSLAIGERMGDALLRGASLVVLPLTALRRHDAEAVRQVAPPAVAACEADGYPEWAAMAKGSLAWLAWQDGRPEEVLALADECEELLGTADGPEMFVNWVRLWPVVATYLTAGQVAEAVDAGRRMLDPSQQRLPDELERMLGSACSAWDEGDSETAAAQLASSLELAHELHYF
jgi:predicted ATPase/class 3 adenylate cyclase